MGTVKVQIKQALFTLLMLLVFSAVVHSQSCPQQVTAQTQLNQIFSQLTTLGNIPQIPTSCNSFMEIKDPLNTVLSYISYSSTSSTTIEQFNNACKAISSVTQAQATACGTDLTNLITTSSKVVSDDKATATTISGPNFCNYCCGALYGTTCINQCQTSCGNGPNAPSCITACNDICNDNLATCNANQATCTISAKQILKFDNYSSYSI